MALFSSYKEKLNEHKTKFFHGGITGIVPGDSQYIQANFESGNYAIFCFLTDPATHEPHFVKGMMAEFTIP